MYEAKDFYKDKNVVQDYEQERFTGKLGSFRYAREQRAVSYVLDHLPEKQLILDCPIGNGRWSEILLARGHEVIGCDISRAMLDAAEVRLSTTPGLRGLSIADAENLWLPNDSVDYVFCHALFKHLPVPIQLKVLTELARVSRRGIVVALSLLILPESLLWRARRIPEAYGVNRELLQEWLDDLGLDLVVAKKCTTPLGVERTMLLSHRLPLQS